MRPDIVQHGTAVFFCLFVAASRGIGKLKTSYVLFCALFYDYIKQEMENVNQSLFVIYHGPLLTANEVVNVDLVFVVELMLLK